eukprot:930766-Amorphochlora_amoeboformis.AAC.1
MNKITEPVLLFRPGNETIDLVVAALFIPNPTGPEKKKQVISGTNTHGYCHTTTSFHWPVISGRDVSQRIGRSGDCAEGDYHIHTAGGSTPGRGFRETVILHGRREVGIWFRTLCAVGFGEAVQSSDARPVCLEKAFRSIWGGSSEKQGEEQNSLSEGSMLDAFIRPYLTTLTKNDKSSGFGRIHLTLNFSKISSALGDKVIPKLPNTTSHLPCVT